MTDRMALLEAVAEAAAAFHQAMLAPIGAQPEGYLTTARERLEDAFSALNALSSHTAEPVGEAVKVRAAVFSNGGEAWTVLGLSHYDDGGVLHEASQYTEGGDEEHVAWITAYVPMQKLVVPVVAARVET